jgi:hypothetical protein
LIVAFADGREQRIDFEPVSHGALYGPLRDLATFNAVRLDAEVGTLVWPNDADFDPATRARAWAAAASAQLANKRMEPTRR